MENELNRCPCGSQPDGVRRWDGKHITLWVVQCPKCGRGVTYTTSAEDAVRVWNHQTEGEVVGLSWGQHCAAIRDERAWKCAVELTAESKWIERAALKAWDRLFERAVLPCVWEYERTFKRWRTGCGKLYYTEYKPDKDRMTYCFHCGRAVQWRWSSMSDPYPPDGYETWLDYAVANMPTRDLHLESVVSDKPVQREEMRAAARAELDALRDGATPSKKTSDAVAILHQRYVGDSLERRAALETARVHAEVARTIHDLRTEAGMSQKELAEAIGTTQSVISRLEDNGLHGYSLAMLNRVAHALDQKVTVVMTANERSFDTREADMPPVPTKRLISVAEAQQIAKNVSAKTALRREQYLDQMTPSEDGDAE